MIMAPSLVNQTLSISALRRNRVWFTRLHGSYEFHVDFSSNVMMSSGEELQIEISGITDISEAEIEVHFQKKKYGGGDVNVTRLEDDKAIMIIEGISPESKSRYKRMLEHNKILLDAGAK